MHQWDIVRVRINESDRDSHRAVVISCEKDCRDPEFLRINVLYGSKKPPAPRGQGRALRGSFIDDGGARSHRPAFPDRPA